MLRRVLLASALAVSAVALAAESSVGLMPPEDFFTRPQFSSHFELSLRGFSQRTADSYTADLIDVLQFMFRRNAAADRIIPFFDISCNSLLQLMIQGT